MDTPSQRDLLERPTAGSVRTPYPEHAHEPPSDLVCSARGCTSGADFGLRWNNPSLHTPERRKTWLACGAHRQHLSDFLTVRGFLRETVTAADLRA